MLRSIIALIITLIIIATIGGIGYLIYDNYQLKTYTKTQEKNIRDISYENELLKHRLYNQTKLIKRYQSTNRELALRNRNLKYSSSEIKTKHYEKKRTYKSAVARITRFEEKSTHKLSTPIKKYAKYTGYKKLVSDSKIQVRQDGRFVSNRPIYGIYKYRLSSGISCGGNPKIYKVENECKAYAP